jgi:outer membrane protein assembly factor BamB
MDPKNILVLGVKGSVVAVNKTTGVQLWTTHLKSSQFVSVAADHSHVYAHTHGELFCLQLQTGAHVWQNNLPGLGYGAASLVLPGLPASADPLFEKRRQDDDAATNSVTHSSTTH